MMKLMKKKNKKNKTENNSFLFCFCYKTVMIVPVTKGGKLIKELKIREEEVNKFSDERIKFVEDGGIQMKDILVKKNPFPNKKCESKRCLVCESNVSDDILIPCLSSNVGYQLICDTCRDRGKNRIYEGETSRSAKQRGLEHLRGFKNDKVENVLYKHRHTEHKHEDMKFSMKIIKRFRDPLSRQANEAVRISSRAKDELLNSKKEFNHPLIARIVVEERGGGYSRQKGNHPPANQPTRPTAQTALLCELKNIVLRFVFGSEDLV